MRCVPKIDFVGVCTDPSAAQAASKVATDTRRHHGDYNQVKAGTDAKGCCGDP